MNTYFRILGYARPFGFLAVLYVICTVLYVIFGVLNLAMLIPVLEIILSNTESIPKPEFEWSLDYLGKYSKYFLALQVETRGQSGAILTVIYALMVSVLLSNTFRYLSSLILARFRVHLITNLRNEFYQKITLLDLGYFTNKNRGDLLSRGTVDLQQVESTVINTLKVLIKDPLMMVGLFVALFAISSKLTLYSMLILPFAGGLISYLARRLKKRARRSQEAIGRINSVLDESLIGMRVIKAFVAENHMIARFRQEVTKYHRHIYKLAVRQNLAAPMSEVLGIATACVIIFIGSGMIFQGALEPQTFIGFLLIFSQLLAPAKAFAGAFSNVQRGIASGERVFEIMDTHYEIKGGEKEINELNEGISFRNVSFAYEEQLVLKDLSFELGKGQIVALVGPSGGGKSTIADLIPRFYDPNDGEILLDGSLLSDYKTSSIRSLVGVVTQESILFNDSVRENITFGQHASEEEIIAAAKTANAHEFIVGLDGGYDAIIGDRGSKLSGGQRQRLSIARALLANPPVLILDEATSALDSESEKLVQEAIYNLMRNRTTLVIAHRLSTIQNANEILVIKEGEIIQRGTHETLLNEGGLYKKLTDMQSF